MGILFGIVILIGLFSWGVVKGDELSGLGRAVKIGSLRHPHGRLEAVYCEPMPSEPPLSARLRAVFPLISALVVAAASAAALMLEGSGRVAGVVAVDVLASGAPVLLIAGECLLRLAKNAQKFTTYILIAAAGLVIATVLGMGVFALAGGSASLGVMAAYLAANLFGFIAGCTIAAAFVEEPVRVQRRFEDGVESAVNVSSRSVAFRAFHPLMVDEEAWEAGKRPE